jgi:hypothetical protein
MTLRTLGTRPVQLDQFSSCSLDVHSAAAHQGVFAVIEKAFYRQLTVTRSVG